MVEELLKISKIDKFSWKIIFKKNFLEGESTVLLSRNSCPNVRHEKLLYRSKTRKLLWKNTKNVFSRKEIGIRVRTSWKIEVFIFERTVFVLTRQSNS